MIVSEKLVYKFFLKQNNKVIFDEWLEKLEKINQIIVYKRLK